MKTTIILLAIIWVWLIDGNTYVTENQIKKQAALLEAEQQKLHNYIKYDKQNN